MVFDENRLQEVASKFHVGKELVDGKECFFVLVSNHPDGTTPRDSMLGLGMESLGFANNYEFEVFCRPAGVSSGVDK